MKVVNVCSVQRFTFSFSWSIEESRYVGVLCLHVLKDLSDFVLVLDLRCCMLYFTINNLANLNFILATKVNRGWILVCLPLSDNFF